MPTAPLIQQVARAKTGVHKEAIIKGKA